MKITLFEKTKEMFQNKFSLKRPNIQEEVIASYFVNMKEAYTNTTYYYVRTKDGKEALYLYPGYKLIAGNEFLSKQELSSLPKKTYQSRQEHIRQEITERFFYNLLSEYKQYRLYKHSKNKYTDGFSYLTSLYYKEDKTNLEAYNQLYKDLKKHCKSVAIIDISSVCSEEKEDVTDFFVKYGMNDDDFKVLIKELQSLGMDVKMLTIDDKEVELRDLDDDDDLQGLVVVNDDSDEENSNLD